MNREYIDYLNDILDEINRIENFIAGIDYDRFAEDDKTFYAVVRSIEIIGEASKQIPEGIKNRFSKIPWKQIAGMRDKLIHGYFGVDIKVVWETITSDLPMIKRALEEMKNNL